MERPDLHDSVAAAGASIQHRPGLATARPAKAAT
jgi:hypothetical protein